MNGKVELYLEEAYNQLKQGLFTMRDCEEILFEQKVFLKAGLMNLAEYGTWKYTFQSGDINGVDCLELSTRGRNCLRRTNIDTCGKLRRLILNGDNIDGLMNIRNLGEKTVHEIIVEAIRHQLISKTELVEAPWTSSHLTKICIYLNARGI